MNLFLSLSLSLMYNVKPVLCTMHLFYPISKSYKCFEFHSWGYLTLSVPYQFCYPSWNLAKITKLKSENNNILRTEKEPLVENQVVSLSWWENWKIWLSLWHIYFELKAWGFFFQKTNILSNCFVHFYHLHWSMNSTEVGISLWLVCDSIECCLHSSYSESMEYSCVQEVFQSFLKNYIWWYKIHFNVHELFQFAFGLEGFLGYYFKVMDYLISLPNSEKIFSVTFLKGNIFKILRISSYVHVW